MASSRTSFLGLPQELRNLIYDFTFARKGGSHICGIARIASLDRSTLVDGSAYIILLLALPQEHRHELAFRRFRTHELLVLRAVLHLEWILKHIDGETFHSIAAVALETKPGRHRPARLPVHLLPEFQHGFSGVAVPRGLEPMKRSYFVVIHIADAEREQWLRRELDFTTFRMLPNDLLSKLSNLALSAPKSPAVPAKSSLFSLPQELRDLCYDFALCDAQGLDFDIITNDETTSLQPFSVAVYTKLFLALPEARRHELSKRPSTKNRMAIFMERTFTPNQVVVFSSRSQLRQVFSKAHPTALASVTSIALDIETQNIAGDEYWANRIIERLPGLKRVFVGHGPYTIHLTSPEGITVSSTGVRQLETLVMALAVSFGARNEGERYIEQSQRWQAAAWPTPPVQSSQPSYEEMTAQWSLTDYLSIEAAWPRGQ
ncbi:hypothetical protein LTS10_010337 [Elasticomyces elasticus]|nr:hypothetical protein LTS10_010337 [Elasticomyces elasticus]